MQKLRYLWPDPGCSHLLGLTLWRCLSTCIIIYITRLFCSHAVANVDLIECVNILKNAFQYVANKKYSITTVACIPPPPQLNGSVDYRRLLIIHPWAYLQCFDISFKSTPTLHVVYTPTSIHLNTLVPSQPVITG